MIVLKANDGDSAMEIRRKCRLLDHKCHSGKWQSRLAFSTKEEEVTLKNTLNAYEKIMG